MDPELVARKVEVAAARLDDVESLLAPADGGVPPNAQARDLAAFYLFLAIQECIDVAAHWVASSGWPAPDQAAAAFDTLGDRGVIGSDLVRSMRAAAGLRNRIAHGYASLDRERLVEEARAGVPVLRTFLAAAATASGR